MFYQSEPSSVIDESLRKSLINAYKNGVLKAGRVENYTLLCPEPCPNKDKLFLLGRELGRGGQGVVYLCQELISLKWYVAKAISNHMMASKENIERERYHLEVIERFEGEVKTDDVTFLLMEYFPGIPLTEILYQIDELAPSNSPQRFKSKKILPSIRRFELCLGTIAAVLRIHHYDVAHRDIKPDNLIVCENNFKNGMLVDLASAIHLSNMQDASFKDNMATKGYTPPELHLPEASRPQYSVKSDYFQLGIVLAEILSKACNYQKLIREHLKKCQENNEFESDLPAELILQSFPEILNNEPCSISSPKNQPKIEVTSTSAINITKLDLNKVATFHQKVEKLKSLKQEIYYQFYTLCQALCQVNVDDRPHPTFLKEMHDEILRLYHQYAVLLKELHSPKEKQEEISPKSTQARRGSLPHTTTVKASLSLSPRRLLHLFSSKKSTKATSPKSVSKIGSTSAVKQEDAAPSLQFDLDLTDNEPEISSVIEPQLFLHEVDKLAQNACHMECIKTANYLNLAKLSFQEEHLGEKQTTSSPSLKRAKPK